MNNDTENKDNKKTFSTIALKPDIKDQFSQARKFLSNKTNFRISNDNIIEYVIHNIYKDNGDDFVKWVANKYIATLNNE